MHINLSLTSSVEFSQSVMCDSLWPYGLQHTRPPCPSPSPGDCSNPCPLSRWCHPTISSSVVPFSSCLQSFSASTSFSVSQFFPSGGQSTGVSASASVFPVNIQDWFPLGWTGWISLKSKGLSRVFSNTSVKKHQYILNLKDFSVAEMVKNLPEMQETRVWSLGWEVEENGNPLQYSCLENSIDWKAWWATVHEVTKSQTLLKD